MPDGCEGKEERNERVGGWGRFKYVRREITALVTCVMAALPLPALVLLE